MMLVLPLIEVVETNVTGIYGLEQLFFLGRSPCSTFADFKTAAATNYATLTCDTSAATYMESPHSWINLEGFDYLAYEYSHRYGSSPASRIFT